MLVVISENVMPIETYLLIEVLIMVDIIFKDLVQGDLQSKKVTVEDRLEMDD